MPDMPPYQQDPAEYGDWLREERALPVRHILAALFVLGLIVCINVYFLHGGVRRRVDYALLRVQAALKRRRPHDLYLPTPDLDRTQATGQPAADPGPDRGGEGSTGLVLLTPSPPRVSAFLAQPLIETAPACGASQVLAASASCAGTPPLIQSCGWPSVMSFHRYEFGE